MWLEGNVFVAFQSKGGDITVNSDDNIDGDNKKTKVLMIKRSIVWCTFWLAGGIQDRKEFGTRVH